MSVFFRPAGVADAEGIAALHADSWRRFYRGAYSDEFLDGDVLADRRAVWSGRLETQGPDSVTILAEAEAEAGSGQDAKPGRVLAGFVHLILDEDARWGSLVDNLHVTHARRRDGLGSALMARAAQAAVDRAATHALYLWVLEQNTAAQAFYAARGGRPAERAVVEAPGGAPNRINGRPAKLRYVWPAARDLLRASTQRTE